MRTRSFIALSVIAILLTACETDYYEPVFDFNTLPTVIPASGGKYRINYDYQYYDTRAYEEFFDWSYRIIVDSEVVKEREIEDDWRGGYFVVDIDRNRDDYPKSIIVEVSTHVRMHVEDYWTDWTPVASTVQLER